MKTSPTSTRRTAIRLAVAAALILAAGLVMPAGRAASQQLKKA